MVLGELAESSSSPTETLPQGFCGALVQSNPPDPAKLRLDDIMGITVILLTCSYNGKVQTPGPTVWHRTEHSCAGRCALASHSQCIYYICISLPCSHERGSSCFLAHRRHAARCQCCRQMLAS